MLAKELGDSARFYFYIDDLTFEGGTPCRATLFSVLTRAAVLLLKIIREDWHAEVSGDKGFVLSTDKDLGASLRKWLGSLGGREVVHGPILGVDSAPGAPRRTIAGPRTKRAARERVRSGAANRAVSAPPL